MKFFAGLTSMVAGLGFGVPCAWGIVHLARTGEAWTFLGCPTYGGGLFDRAGIETTVPLLLGFLVVCVIEVALAVMIWTGQAVAKTVGYVMLPIELMFWLGFSLPAGPPLGVARTILLALAA
ncbi:MAG: hypothetical protein OEY70_13555 [Acidimicrobiia bacterium]|nr:hypothetical protein [Acidimicrobiia bacterium]